MKSPLDRHSPPVEVVSRDSLRILKCPDCKLQPYQLWIHGFPGGIWSFHVLQADTEAEMKRLMEHREELNNVPESK